MGHLYLDGGCACDATRYRMLAPPLIVHACHCRMCQTLTGSTHAVNALIETCHLRLLCGEVVDNIVATPSGFGQVVTRCAACRVAIWSTYNRFCAWHGVSVRFVRVGTLDTPERVPPDVQIYTRSRIPHACIDRRLPSFSGFYDLGLVWSDASQQRLTLERARAAGATQSAG